jgi:hypothetical protein
MIEEVINEPDGGWESIEVPDDVYVTNERYIKLKGTFYETYYYDEPATDLVYFPGDELPEGYEVRITEDYEALVCNFIDDSQELAYCITFLPVEKNGEVVDYELAYPDDYLGQQLYYGEKYRTL